MKYKEPITRFKNDYKFLSNFYKSTIIYQEKEYPTAEHLYQALKTNDKKLREKIRLLPTPGKAKRAGQTIKLRENWEKVKDKIMFVVVRLKFLQNSEISEHLFNTGENILIEDNYWHDNYWGNCICLKCKPIKGKNQLGKILMKIRRMI